MRKVYYLTMALTLATMAGCQEDEQFVNVQSSSNQTFYATFENGADTRTALDVSNNVIWSEGDQISVFGGTTANNAFILNEGANTNYGTFRVNSLVAGTESSGSTSALSANVAYYPYDSNVTVSESNGSYTFNATFPAEQTYSESGTFGNGASPMVAVTSSTLDADLKFKNVGAIFRLQLKGNATITHIVFSAEANLAGKVAITASNTSLPTVNVTEGTNTIVLDCGENGVQLSDELTNFVVAMLPVETLGDLTITIYDNAGKKMVSTWNNHSTIERSKAYTTDEITYNGNEDANTQLSVQAALDAATDNTTIQLEPDVNYGVLYIRQNTNSSIVDITDIGGDAVGNEKYRKIENLTIKGAPGAVVDQILFQASTWLDTERYASYLDIKNLTVEGVTFSGEATAFNLDASKGTVLGIDGLTIKNCTMNDATGSNRFVFQQIGGYKELTDKSTQKVVMTTGIKNLSITGCQVDGVSQLIEAREMENLSITDNTIKNTTKHAILLAHNSGAVNYSGDITITDNTIDGIGDRFLRMAGAGDAQIVINNNTITNFKGEDADYIKVEGLTTNGSIDTKNNTLEVATTKALQAALDFATEGTTINLVPGVEYDVVYMGRPTKNNDTEMYCSTDNFTTKNAALFKAHIAETGYHYTPQYTTTIKDLTVNGANGATIAGLEAISGNVHQNAYDLILDRENNYLLDLHLNNIKFLDVDFVGNIDINTNSSAEKKSVYDGITFEGCSFTTGGTADENGPAIRYYSEANDGNIKNIKVDDCTFTNCFQGVYVHHVNGITVTDSHFDTTGHNAIAIQSHDDGDAVNLKNVVITDNTFNNISDRVIRFNLVGADSNITIQRNTATNSGDEDGEVMKATSIEQGITTNISNNNWNGGVVFNDELKDK